MRTLLISAVVSMFGCGAGSEESVRWTRPSTTLEQGCAPLGPEDFTQGALTTSNIPTDLALDGKGFFVLRNADGLWFTRDGRFTLDADSGFVHVASGGRMVGVGGGELSLGTGVAVPFATANITLTANLDSAAPIQTFDPSNPATTSAGQSSVTVFDSVGRAYSIDVYWTQSAARIWDFHAMTDGSLIAGGGAGVAWEIASGTLRFDDAGRLDSTRQQSNFHPALSTVLQPLNFNLGDPRETGGSGLSGLTQFRAPTATFFASQDGAPMGTLVSYAFNSRGEILATYTNGTTTVLGSVALAAFDAPDQLRLRGNGLFEPTARSGQPTIGPAGDGARPFIVGSALEKLPDYTKCVVR